MNQTDGKQSDFVLLFFIHFYIVNHKNIGKYRTHKILRIMWNFHTKNDVLLIPRYAGIDFIEFIPIYIENVSFRGPFQCKLVKTFTYSFKVALHTMGRM